MGKGKKTGLIVAGAAVAGASFVLLNANARNKVKNTSISVKDSVSKYTQAIKENPQGSKDAIVQRIQNATETSKEAVTKMQLILDEQATKIKQSAKSMLRVKSTENVKDANDERDEAKDKAIEAKDEVQTEKDDLDLEPLASK